MSQDPPIFDAPLTRKGFAAAWHQIDTVAEIVAMWEPVYDDFLKTLEREELGPAPTPEVEASIQSERDWMRRLAEALKNVADIHAEGRSW